MGGELEASQGGTAPFCPAWHLLGKWLGSMRLWQPGQVPPSLPQSGSFFLAWRLHWEMIGQGGEKGPFIYLGNSGNRNA